MSTIERREKIVHLIQKQGKVTVEEAGRLFGVSAVTVRSDLHYLEERGLVHRTHGGALTRDFVAFDTALTEKTKKHADEKQRIGKAAAGMIFDGDSIILDSGTTTLEIAKALKNKKNITVMTNAINIATELAGISRITVLLTGGMLREKSFSLVGPHAETVLRGFYFDKLFLGVDGFDVEFGLTTPNILEAKLNRLMVEMAKETIVVVDSSKFKHRSLSLICPVDRIHKVITDSAIPSDDLEKLKSLEIEVVLT